jgi:pimeloyl-ACP methyl ester carboxylesterase
MQTLTRINRRQALRALGSGAAAATFANSGFARDIFVVGDGCPKDPAEQGGIDWVPDVMHPVAAGFQDYGVAQRAPGNVRVWYPSYELPIDRPERPAAGGPILKGCLARFPIVLLTHGLAPCGFTGQEYYKRWDTFPADLARSGYVVLAPQIIAVNPFEDSTASAMAPFIDWARTGWEHAQWTDKRPESTAVVGHSFGAMVAVRIALTRPTIGACVLLSGVWEQFDEHVEMLKAINRPTLFTYVPGASFEDMNSHQLWNSLPYTKYAAEFPGEHFDYIDQTPAECDPRGGCRLIQPAIADLAALFLGRFVPPAHTATSIPASLEPPPSPLSAKQQPYGAFRLRGLERIETLGGCSLDLKWKGWGLTFTRHFGPLPD